MVTAKLVEPDERRVRIRREREHRRRAAEVVLERRKLDIKPNGRK